MMSQTAWNQLSDQQLLERAYSVAESLHSRDDREDRDTAGLIRQLAWRLKGSLEWIESGPRNRGTD